ncbi:MAG: DNA-3-methyladenine glycosylase [Cyclobacteriaceae bacterium]|nr:DNA-3-methyladenine glycosylase [Cyclobacteriaceae bacterium]
MATVPASIKHLNKDRILRTVIRRAGPIRLKKGDKVYLRLCGSIISQQLSTKAADTIYTRFLAIYDGAEPTADQILATPEEALRKAGLSGAKASYLHNVAAFEKSHGMDENKLSKMTNEEVIDYLTSIKGVGKWTVEMLLMFVLARPDVFPIDDVGIQNALVDLYGLNRKHKTFRKKAYAIAEQWAPYRTYACLYLWRSLNF